MSGIPIGGTTAGAGTVAGAAGAAGSAELVPAPEGLLESTFGGLGPLVSTLPFTGIGVLSLMVAAFTLLACGLALHSLVPRRRPT